MSIRTVNERDVEHWEEQIVWEGKVRRRKWGEVEGLEGKCLGPEEAMSSSEGLETGWEGGGRRAGKYLTFKVDRKYEEGEKLATGLATEGATDPDGTRPVTRPTLHPKYDVCKLEPIPTPNPALLNPKPYNPSPLNPKP